MKTKIAGISVAALLAASLSAPASAAFISGTLSFSGFLEQSSLGSIVSPLTFFDLAPPTNSGGGTGDFLGVSGLTATTDIDINAPAGVIYSVAGYSFTLESVNSVTSSPIACANSRCADEKAFNIVGTVSAAGFDDTSFLGNFTANGSCLEGVAGACEPGTESASWSSSVVATGNRVPVPATLALLGLGLAGLGWSQRSKA